jgi:hypothetical protein
VVLGEKNVPISVGTEQKGEDEDKDKEKEVKETFNIIMWMDHRAQAVFYPEANYVILFFIANLKFHRYRNAK